MQENKHATLLINLHISIHCCLTYITVTDVMIYLVWSYNLKKLEYYNNKITFHLKRSCSESPTHTMEHWHGKSVGTWVWEKELPSKQHFYNFYFFIYFLHKIIYLSSSASC